MSYPIETKIAAKTGWHTPSEAKSYYGRYARDGVTVHWWNSPDKVKDSDHDNIVNYILNKARNGTGSVNYVLSNNKISMLVEPDNVSWASQSGNPTTVSVEFSPHLNDEGYKKAGWLISQLEKRYGKAMRLYKHSDWYSTACPGSLDLGRMRHEANRWNAGDYNPKPPAPTPPAKAELVWEKLPTPKLYKTNKPTTNLWDFNNTTWNMKSVKQFGQGEQMLIYGKVLNKTLGALYLLTEYSYTRGITNGFNQADLDEYVEPKPVPTPIPTPTPEPVPDPEEPEPTPEPEDPTPTNPEPTVPPEDSNFEKRLNALEVLVKLITDFLDKIFKWRN